MREGTEKTGASRKVAIAWPQIIAARTGRKIFWPPELPFASVGGGAIDCKHTCLLIVVANGTPKTPAASCSVISARPPSSVADLNRPRRAIAACALMSIGSHRKLYPWPRAVTGSREASRWKSEAHGCCRPTAELKSRSCPPNRSRCQHVLAVEAACRLLFAAGFADLKLTIRWRGNRRARIRITWMQCCHTCQTGRESSLSGHNRI